MTTTQVVKSVCGLCVGSCGVLVTLEDGKAVDIKGDPERPPNQGNLCPIGLASLEYLYHPDRLTHPLRRAGGRGEGKWQQISWDEAFHLAAEALDKVKQEYGPEAVVMVQGSAKGSMDTHLVRLANAFGTPNVACAEQVCHMPRVVAAELTFGFFPGADYGYPPACIISWGANDADTMSCQRHQWFPGSDDRLPAELGEEVGCASGQGRWDPGGQVPARQLRSGDVHLLWRARPRGLPARRWRSAHPSGTARQLTGVPVDIEQYPLPRRQEKRAEDVRILLIVHLIFTSQLF